MIKKIKRFLKNTWWGIIIAVALIPVVAGLIWQLFIVKKNEAKYNVKKAIKNIKKRNRKLNNETEDFIKESDDFLRDNPPYKLRNDK